MRHFYKNVVSGLVFWLLLSQSLSLFNSSSAAAVKGGEETAVAAEETMDSVANEEEGSEGRYFGDFIKLVKRQIDDVETGRSSSGIFNTTVAFTVPLFSFTLPDRASAGKDYTKQAALSLIGLAIVGGIAVIPYVWQAASGTLGKKDWLQSHSVSGRSINSDKLSSRVLPMLYNFASSAGLDGRTCMQRSVCEAYRQPERYGYLVLPVRYFMISQTSRSDGTPSDFQMAADYGRSDPGKCEVRYRCAFSLIGAVNFLTSYFYPPKVVA